MLFGLKAVCLSAADAPPVDSHCRCARFALLSHRGTHTGSQSICTGFNHICGKPHTAELYRLAYNLIASRAHTRSRRGSRHFKRSRLASLPAKLLVAPVDVQLSKRLESKRYSLNATVYKGASECRARGSSSVPQCMLEASALGSPVDSGTIICNPIESGAHIEHCRSAECGSTLRLARLSLVPGPLSVTQS